MPNVHCPLCYEQTEKGPECASCGGAPKLQGRYWLTRMLGHGAQGYTWKAEDDAGNLVAIKELSFRRLTAMKAVELFEREAETLRGLSHPGIPKYLDHFGVEDPRHFSMYLVQEFIDGSALKLDRRWTEPEILTLLDELEDVLTYLGSLRPPVVHRDLKPSNIMQRSDGSFVLIDFGTTRQALEDTVGGSTVAGTFGYMAPEQFAGSASPASDVYGLGATVIALLSGSDASRLLGESGRDSWAQRLTASDGMLHLLRRMLDVQPDRRPTGGFRAIVEGYRAPELPQRQLAKPEAEGSPGPTRPMLLWAAYALWGLCFLILGGGTVVMLIMVERGLITEPTFGPIWMRPMMVVALLAGLVAVAASRFAVASGDPNSVWMSTHNKIFFQGILPTQIFRRRSVASHIPSLSEVDGETAAFLSKRALSVLRFTAGVGTAEEELWEYVREFLRGRSGEFAQEERPMVVAEVLGVVIVGRARQERPAQVARGLETLVEYCQEPDGELRFSKGVRQSLRTARHYLCEAGGTAGSRDSESDRRAAAQVRRCVYRINHLLREHTLV